MTVTDALDARPWRGDPCSIVTASDADEHRREFARRITRARPDWMAHALCAEFDVDLWFPTTGQSNQPALDICGRCPVRVECLDWAIANDERHGIFGGMSTPARRAHARARRAEP